MSSERLKKLRNERNDQVEGDYINESSSKIIDSYKKSKKEEYNIRVGADDDIEEGSCTNEYEKK